MQCQFKRDKDTGPGANALGTEFHLNGARTQWNALTLPPTGWRIKLDGKVNWLLVAVPVVVQALHCVAPVWSLWPVRAETRNARAHFVKSASAERAPKLDILDQILGSARAWPSGAGAPTTRPAEPIFALWPAAGGRHTHSCRYNGTARVRPANLEGGGGEAAARLGRHHDLPAARWLARSPARWADISRRHKCAPRSPASSPAQFSSGPGSVAGSV